MKDKEKTIQEHIKKELSRRLKIKKTSDELWYKVLIDTIEIGVAILDEGGHILFVSEEDIDFTKKEKS